LSNNNDYSFFKLNKGTLKAKGAFVAFMKGKKEI